MVISWCSFAIRGGSKNGLVIGETDRPSGIIRTPVGCANLTPRVTTRFCRIQHASFLLSFFFCPLFYIYVYFYTYIYNIFLPARRQDDGIFWMSLPDLRKYFKSVTVCRLRRMFHQIRWPLTMTDNVLLSARFPLACAQYEGTRLVFLVLYPTSWIGGTAFFCCVFF
jgi:hypothetical protein